MTGWESGLAFGSCKEGAEESFLTPANIKVVLVRNLIQELVETLVQKDTGLQGGYTAEVGRGKTESRLVEVEEDLTSVMGWWWWCDVGWSES